MIRYRPTSPIKGLHVLDFKEIKEINPGMKSIHRDGDNVKSNLVLRAKFQTNQGNNIG